MTARITSMKPLLRKTSAGRVREIRVCHIREYDEDAVAWRDFQAATRLAQVAGTLIYRRLKPEAPRAVAD